MAEVLWVGAGGFLGAVARWMVTGWFRSAFPAGTMVVNLLGSFALGMLAEALVDEVFAIPVPFRLFVLVGFLGSFTTFSTFSLETVRLLESRNLHGVVLYVSQVLTGPAMAFAGMVLMRWILLRR